VSASDGLPVEPIGDRSRLMQEVGAQMDAIEADFGEDFQIGRVLTIVEVHTADDVSLRVRAGHFPWVTDGMLEWAKRALRLNAGDAP